MATKNKFWTGEKLLSFSAVFISVLTLIVFLYQTSLIRKQQYASAFPYVSLGHHGWDSKNYRFVIDNGGVGPAIITKVTIEDNKGNIYHDVVNYIDANITDEDSIEYFFANISPGRLLSEKDYVEVIGVGDGKLSTADHLGKLLNPDKVKIEIEYESIYGETWVASNAADYPLKK